MSVAQWVEVPTELLQLTSSASGPAEKVFHQITSHVEAAFTAALSVLKETLALATGQDLKMTDLEKGTG